jgi:hypothetical protein
MKKKTRSGFIKNEKDFVNVYVFPVKGARFTICTSPLNKVLMVCMRFIFPNPALLND